MLALFIAPGFLGLAAKNGATTNGGGTTSSGSSPPLLVARAAIRLPNSAGRIDHMDYDPLDNRLFVAEFGNNSVAVIDLASNTLARVLTGFDGPQGVLYVPRYDELFVSNGGTGVVDIYNATSLQLRSSVKLASNADNLRLELGSQTVYVGFGEGNASGIATINATNGTVTGTIPLPGHPESFQLEQNGSRIFANVPSKAAVFVVNRTTRALIGTLPLPGYVANFPMALDEPGHRLFVGTWAPPELVVYDTDSSKLVANLTISQNADDMFFEPQLHLIYISCTAGFIDVVRQGSLDSYALASSIPTSSGARTSLLVLNPPRLYLGIPASGSTPAEIEIVYPNA